MLNLHKRSLATLLLAIMALMMLAGCSSTDEASQSEDPSSSGDSDCLTACQAAPAHKVEECSMSCGL
jgi:uncharacterized lipoprotein